MRIAIRSCFLIGLFVGTIWFPVHIATTVTLILWALSEYIGDVL